MGIVHGQIEGASVMICRLSFSGERAYEVYCGAGHGQHVWEALMEAGEPFDITPYGMEALGALRIEKGHVTGAEIDGRTTARDLYLDWMLSKKKPFIGSGLMDRPALIDRNRLRLVGIVSLDGQKLGGGAHLVERNNPDEPGESIGHVTAYCYSPALQKYIGLALVRGGKARHGTRVLLSDPLRLAFRSGGDRQPPFLRSGWGAHAWLSAHHRWAAISAPAPMATLLTEAASRFPKR